MDPGRVLIQFRGHKFNARIDLRGTLRPTLVPGKAYSFLVKGVDQGLVLKLVQVGRADSLEVMNIWNSLTESQARIASLLKELISVIKALPGDKGRAPQFMGNTKGVEKLLSTLLFDPSSKARAVQLRETILGSGLFWEAKVSEGLNMGKLPEVQSDLKGALQHLASRLEEAHKEEAAELLKAIQQHQVMSLKMDGAIQWWLFFIPVFQDHDLELARVFVKREKQGGLRLVIHLNLTRLGRMEVAAYMEGEGEKFLDLMVGVESEASKRMVEANIGQLDEALREAGISLRSFSCDQVEFAAMLPPGLGRERPASIVDLTV